MGGMSMNKRIDDFEIDDDDIIILVHSAYIKEPESNPMYADSDLDFYGYEDFDYTVINSETREEIHECDKERIEELIREYYTKH
jgi:hypothetical protein